MSVYTSVVIGDRASLPRVPPVGMDLADQSRQGAACVAPTDVRPAADRSRRAPSVAGAGSRLLGWRWYCSVGAPLTWGPRASRALAVAGARWRAPAGAWR